MYRKILLAIDGSESSRRALNEASRIAALVQGSVHALYVVDAWGISPYAGYYDPKALARVLRDDGHQILESACKAMAGQGVQCDVEMDETQGKSDDIADCVQRCAQRQNAELVIMGTHGRHGLGKAVLGSVAERFLHIATCPVMLVRDPVSQGAPTVQGEKVP